MKNKIDIAAMTEEEREEYMLNCAAYNELARNMKNAALGMQNGTNKWAFGCSFFPDSVFPTIELNPNRETVVVTVLADDIIKNERLIFDGTNIDMTRPFAVQTTYINCNRKKDFFLTLVQYLD